MSDKSTVGMIVECYSRDTEKVAATLQVFRTSRKYGFPIINGITDKSEQEQFIWAVRFLLSIAGTWPIEDFPIEDAAFVSEINKKLVSGVKLYDDAMSVLANSTSNTERL